MAKLDLARLFARGMARDAGYAARSVAAIALFACAVAPAGVSCAAPTPPVPVPADIAAFVGDPALGKVQISPSGKFLAMVRSNGLCDELVVEDLATGKITPGLKTKPLPTGSLDQDVRQHISYVHWKSDDDLIVTVQIPYRNPVTLEVGIGEDIHFAIRRADMKNLALNPRSAQNRSAVNSSYIVDALPNDPDHVLLSGYDDAVDRVDIHTAARTQIEGGGPRVLGYGVDRHGVINTRTLIAGSDASPYLLLQARASSQSSWTKLWELHEGDLRAMQDIDILSEAAAPGEVYVRYRPASKADGDTYSIRTFNLTTKTLGPVIWSHPKYDADSIFVDDATGKFLGACYVEDVEVCQLEDPKLDGRLKAISKFFAGRANIEIASRSADDSKWVLRIFGPDEPMSYYMLDLKALKIEPIGAALPRMQAAGTGTVRRFDYKTRDGAALTAYVTTPKGPGPHPLVVMPHGGPETRDSLSFDVYAQFLAGRGYEVIQPNFRGSSGFGVAFAEAGYGQWGGRMQDDITDAVKALAAAGEIDRRRICIFGASYGGYAALYAAATQAELYRCAISLDGVTDLLDTVAETRERYGVDSLAYKYDRRAIGDPSRDAARLRATSPTHRAAEIAMPVLLIHGTDDRVVSVEQARKMKRALEAAKKSVRYVEIRHMGHGPSLDSETVQVLTEVGAFLDAQIGPSKP